MNTPSDLRCLALRLLAETCPQEKVRQTRQLAADWLNGGLALDRFSILHPPPTLPGKPERPVLVAPRAVKRRSLHTAEGRATLIHALAHIEFNAINLALDLLWRFADMPPAFYADWLRVADEEALHFSLLAAHLQRLGFLYGDFPAHSGLWDMAEKTKNDLLARLAMIPRTMEARGLDVTPGLRAKLAQSGDLEAARILDLILRDEIGHVTLGNHWFAWLCGQRGLAPQAAYQRLLADYHAPQLRGPFNLEARRKAGFSEQELRALAFPAVPD